MINPRGANDPELRDRIREALQDGPMTIHALMDAIGCHHRVTLLDNIKIMGGEILKWKTQNGTVGRPRHLYSLLADYQCAYLADMLILFSDSVKKTPIRKWQFPLPTSKIPIEHSWPDDRIFESILEADS